MNLVVLFVSLTAFVSGGWSEPNQIKDNPVLGYLTKVAIPEAERIRKVEEEYLENQSSRIIGGAPAAVGQFPYQAGLISYIINTTRVGVCGGSLVSTNRVVTAAHCWFDGLNQVSKFTVVLGSILLFTGGIRQETSSVVTYSSWRPLIYDNDVAILRLPGVVQTSARISPIALPRGADYNATFFGAQAIAPGFGLTAAGGSITGNQSMNFVRLNVISNFGCSLAHLIIIGDNNICTSSSLGSGPCQGDTGGPLVVQSGGRDILVGITLSGPKLSCGLGIPSVYARVTSFMGFINANL